MIKKYWQGPDPTDCELCNQPLKELFIDGAIHSNSDNGSKSAHPWTIACLPCAQKNGIIVGIGYGQIYCKETIEEKTRWLCIGGSNFSELEEDICTVCEQPQSHCECA